MEVVGWLFEGSACASARWDEKRKGSNGREKYNGGRILNRNCSDSIIDYFQDSAGEECDEVVGVVLDERLIELNDSWYEIKDCSDNSSAKLGL